MAQRPPAGRRGCGSPSCRRWSRAAPTGARYQRSRWMTSSSGLRPPACGGRVGRPDRPGSRTTGRSRTSGRPGSRAPRARSPARRPSRGSSRRRAPMPPASCSPRRGPRSQTSDSDAPGRRRVRRDAARPPRPRRRCARRTARRPTSRRSVARSSTATKSQRCWFLELPACRPASTIRSRWSGVERPVRNRRTMRLVRIAVQTSVTARLRSSACPARLGARIVGLDLPIRAGHPDGPGQRSEAARSSA